MQHRLDEIEQNKMQTVATNDVLAVKAKNRKAEVHVLKTRLLESDIEKQQISLHLTRESTRLRDTMQALHQQNQITSEVFRNSTQGGVFAGSALLGPTHDVIMQTDGEDEPSVVNNLQNS